MNRKPPSRTARWALLLAVGALLIGAQTLVRVRPPFALGNWYPADPAELRSTVKRFVDTADAPVPGGRLVACIIPNGAYGLSGDVAGYAVKALKPGQYDRVIVLCDSHVASFHGCSIPSVQVCQTPLGDVWLDGAAIQRLAWSTVFTIQSLRYE